MQLGPASIIVLVFAGMAIGVMLMAVLQRYAQRRSRLNAIHVDFRANVAPFRAGMAEVKKAVDDKKPPTNVDRPSPRERGRA